MTSFRRDHKLNTLSQCHIHRSIKEVFLNIHLYVQLVVSVCVCVCVCVCVMELIMPKSILTVHWSKYIRECMHAASLHSLTCSHNAIIKGIIEDKRSFPISNHIHAYM